MIYRLHITATTTTEPPTTTTTEPTAYYNTQAIGLKKIVFTYRYSEIN